MTRAHLVVPIGRSILALCFSLACASLSTGQELRRLPPPDRADQIELVVTIAHWRETEAEAPQRDLYKMRLSDLEKSDTLTSLTRVKLVTTPGQSVEHDAEERVYYVVAVDKQGRKTRAFMRVGTFVQVTARIREGKIQSDIKVRTSSIVPGVDGQLVGRTPKGQPLRAPARRENGVDTSVALENGQTTVVGGGLEDDRDGSGGTVFWVSATIRQ